MPILDMQRKGQQIGRLRIGQQIKASNGKMRPAKLDSFRFTTGSRVAADAVAHLYGGTVRDWEGEYEVVTDKSAIGVTVPPRDQIVTQWYEMWSKGGCQRRCDSQTEQISGGPCLCPHSSDPDDVEAVAEQALERSRLAHLNPPQACKLVTRINVMIPDLPGLGVWRLDTGSYYAAAEIGDSGELMHMARDRGVFLPAMLRIEQRSRVAGGQTKRFPVPVLEVLATFRDIATGAIEAGGLVAQLPPAPDGERRAIAAASPGPSPAPPPAVPAAEPDDHEARTREAQQIADLAAQATSRDVLHRLVVRAREARYGTTLVCTDRDHDVWEELGALLNDLWAKLAPPKGGTDA
jgi:hypothetical protein